MKKLFLLKIISWDLAPWACNSEMGYRIWRIGLYIPAKVTLHDGINVSVFESGQFHQTRSYMIVSEKTDHLAPKDFVQYGPKVLQRSRSRDFAISMSRCSTAS